MSEKTNIRVIHLNSPAHAKVVAHESLPQELRGVRRGEIIRAKFDLPVDQASIDERMARALADSEARGTTRVRGIGPVTENELKQPHRREHKRHPLRWALGLAAVAGVFGIAGWIGAANANPHDKKEQAKMRAVAGTPLPRFRVNLTKGPHLASDLKFPISAGHTKR